MKNIHVLPTEKPSRFYSTARTSTKKSGYAFGEHYIPNTRNMFSNHNIYITSNEDINENDYIITKDGRLVPVSYLLSKDLEGASKIILTTDQDLIKNGVQAIDDEFLEWFVKNPSCEEVEVQDISMQYHDEGYYEYKIIIPKEESKQNIIDNWLEKNGDPEIAKQVEQEAKELCEQETLEEISPMNDLLIDLRETKISVKESIDLIEDEFMRTQINIFIQKTLDSVIDRIENELLETESKWQQEQDKKTYSEDDISTAIAMYLENKSFSEIIKQLKNK